jgi:hypothetical protein
MNKDRYKTIQDFNNPIKIKTELKSMIRVAMINLTPEIDDQINSIPNEKIRKSSNIEIYPSINFDLVFKD